MNTRHQMTESKARAVAIAKASDRKDGALLPQRIAAHVGLALIAAMAVIITFN